MKIEALPNALTQLARGASSISFTSGDDFASKLTLGQIIKGRVLRSYEGSRYLVDFNGHQKVVDSAVPLRADEVIYGRVVGLSDRVELQRINANIATPATDAIQQAPATPLNLTGSSGQLIAGLFERFQAQLAADDLALLQRAVSRAVEPEHMAQAGLVLAKLGVPLSMEALRAVFDALRADRRAAMFALPKEAIHLATQTTGSDAVMPNAAAFSVLLSDMLSTLPELQQKSAQEDATQAPDANSPQAQSADFAQNGYRRASTRGQDDRAKDADVARLILNVQSGGAVSHRVGTLPLFVDGRLVELNIALFEQTGDRQADGANVVHHRHVVFAVTTETLGRVEVRASIAGSHMRVKVSAEARESTQFLAAHAGGLASQLENLGWTIDELLYQTTSSAAPGAVAQTILEHLIAPGSVSALA